MKIAHSGLRFGIGAVALAWALRAQPAPDLEAGFRAPPASVKPQTLWFWMNGNVSRDGITRDLEAMQRVGIGGAMMFDGGTYLPEGPAKYLNPEWRALMAHAIQEADRLGLTLGMHNAPGWSSSGGPWITPEHAMQQLVWSETTLPGGRALDVPLPQPSTTLGYYRDAYVLAFPALAAEAVPDDVAIRVVTRPDGQIVAKAMLSDDNLATSVAVPAGEYLRFEFATPAEIQAVTVRPANGGRFPAINVEVSEDGATFRRVASVANPGKHGIQPPGVAGFAPARARFVRVAPAGPADLAEVRLHRAARIEDWNFKGNFAFRLGRQVAIPAPVDTASAIDPAKVVDLTAKIDASGRLKWNAPEGPWTILRIGYTPTGQLNVSASAAGTGLECDKFSREAVDDHFNHVVGQVLADAGSLAGKSFTGVEIDSYEVGMQNWSAAFPAEFQRRAGYDLRGWLPALAGGRIVGDAARSERFLFDLRRVQADLMAENYYGRMQELCRGRGLKFHVEGYGQAVFDELQVSGLPDFPMTEFWERTPWTPNRTVKSVASAAHIYGKAVVASESFTGEEETARWEEYPYALKVLGDDMFALGVNQMLFHRFAHQPHPTAVPGMAMGPWGFHFDRTNTWFEQSGPWLRYLARCQFLLRQGTAVADVAYFVGERPPNVAQHAIPSVPAGFNYDLVNEDVLLHRASARDGRMLLPGGGSYALLVLPPDLTGMTPELMNKLRELVAQGVAILGPKPAHSLTLRGFPASEAELRRGADELWDDAAPREPHRGRVFAAGEIADALRALKATPDFEFVGTQPDAAVSWVHRALPGAEIYFVANRQRRAEEITAMFRAADRQPEIWRAETGEVTAAAIYSRREGRTIVPLRLEPAESVFVVFRKPATGAVAKVLKRDGRDLIAAEPPATAAPPTVTQSFTVAVWAKPDVNLRTMPREGTTGWIDETGKNYVVPAGEGDRRFGSGHALAGLAVGRNGAYVVERSSAAAPAVLVATMPIAGWTHFAVVYRDGKPRLYVNGKFVREGLVSGSVVHPGLGSPPPDSAATFHFAGLDSLRRASGLPPLPSQGMAYYFEGNQTRPELFDHALSDEAIAELAGRGLPPPEDPPAAEVSLRSDGGIEAVVWASGAYALGDGLATAVRVAKPMEISGPWPVSFQSGRGAPAALTLPELSSWHRSTDTGVKYFSGTGVYRHAFDVATDALAPDKRVVLDLGRVEVIAEVSVNGKTLGTLWKEPFRIDVTDAVHAGANALEVRVTNLWPNRLIGDEQLPAENDYGTRNGEHGIVKLPAWYAAGEPKPPGGRVTFTTWKFFTKDEPLLESGLLGPVRVLNPVRLTLAP